MWSDYLFNLDGSPKYDDQIFGFILNSMTFVFVGHHHLLGCAQTDGLYC